MTRHPSRVRPLLEAYLRADSPAARAGAAGPLIAAILARRASQVPRMLAWVFEVLITSDNYVRRGVAKKRSMK